MKRLTLVFLVGLLLVTSLPVNAAHCPTETNILFEFDAPDYQSPTDIVHYYVTGDPSPVPYVYIESNGQPGLQRNDPAVGEDNCGHPDRYVI